jgi:hypothetical protein
MINPRQLGKVLSLAAFFGVALYAVVYFMASHSEAFEFVEQRIKSSWEIKTQLGEIKEVRLSLFGSYDQKSRALPVNPTVK